MLNESFVQLENCQVTAQLVLTQLVRLHQICAGFLMQEGMDPIPLEGKNDRIEALLSILEEAPGKVIIWAIYRQSIRSILAAVREKFGEDSIVDFYGETSEKNRQENKELFQDPDSKVRFIVSNAASGKFGNTWIAAKTAVYFQSDFNLESRRQSEARCHRVGQDGAVHDLDDSADYFDESGNKITPEKSPSVLYIDLIAPGTIEERMLKVVKAKKKLSDEVLASNWRWLLGQQIK
jgi:SNF2 family DNA or RNA helicase